MSGIGSGSGTVSCVLLTRARPAFFSEAVRGFLAQDYPDRELVVVDDGDRPVEALLPADDRIRYFHLAGRPSIGEKRNFGCRHARGEYVAHTDDDDWYPPDRLTRQVGALSAAGASICGTRRLYFLDLLVERAWLYSYPRADWLAGASLVYRRAVWQRSAFRLVQVGEDWSFVRSAFRGTGGLVDLDDPGLCVATLHGQNANPKRPDAYWTAVDVAMVAARMGEQANAYRVAAMAAAAGAPASALAGVASRQ